MHKLGRFCIFSVIIAAVILNWPGLSCAYKSATLNAEDNVDWSQLTVGRKPFELSTVKVIEATGDFVRRVYKDQDEVAIRDKFWRIKWRRGYDKYSNTLYHVRNCKSVIVENIAVIQFNDDYRASQALLIEDCDNVIIRNCYFAGANGKSHLRIEGCKNVYIDSVEVAGLDYGTGKGVRCGGGIFINNGSGGDSRPVTQIYSPSPKVLESLVIRNCYIHDNIKADIQRNQDGILVHSGINGMIFNCFFENWLAGDAALDISHRRLDKAYTDATAIVERNIFKHCRIVKTPGRGLPSSKIVFANNIYIDSSLVDYHQSYKVWHLNESLFFSKSAIERTFFKIWGIDQAETIIKRCLISAKGISLYKLYSLTAKAKSDDIKRVVASDNVYLMDSPTYFLYGMGFEVKSWVQWLAIMPSERDSVLMSQNDSWITEDYKTMSNVRDKIKQLKYKNENSDKINKDFWGRPRGLTSSPGAFEF
jgi:hypothetical protein